MEAVALAESLFDRVSDRLVAQLLKCGIVMPAANPSSATPDRMHRQELERSYGEVSAYDWSQLDVDRVGWESNRCID